MKPRKGFGKIDINGEKFLFNWAMSKTGIMLVLYDSKDKKIEIPIGVWHQYPDSKEFLENNPNVWHGKRRTGPCIGGWGKREAREMYFKYIRYIEDFSVMFTPTDF